MRAISHIAITVFLLFIYWFLVSFYLFHKIYIFKMSYNILGARRKLCKAINFLVFCRLYGSESDSELGIRWGRWSIAGAFVMYPLVCLRVDVIPDWRHPVFHHAPPWVKHEFLRWTSREIKSAGTVRKNTAHCYTNVLLWTPNHPHK